MADTDGEIQDAAPASNQAEGTGTAPAATESTNEIPAVSNAPATPAGASQDTDAVPGSGEQSKDQAKQEVDPLQERIDRLTKPKNTEDADDHPTRTKPATDQVESTKDGNKDAAGNKPVGNEIPEKPPKDAKAWASLRHEAQEGRKLKQTVDAYEKERAYVEPGKNWVGFVEEHRLTNDLEAISTDDLAEAIRVTSASKRIAAGNGTQNDQKLVEQFQANRGLVRESKPAVDLNEIERLLGDYRFDEARELIVNAKKSAKKPEAKPAEQTQQTSAPPHKVEASKSWTHADETAFQQLNARKISAATGISEMPQLIEHINANLIPAVFDEIRAISPRENPAAVFKSLNPATRHTYLMEAQSKWNAAQQKAKAEADAKAAQTQKNRGGQQRGPIPLDGHGRRPGTTGTPPTTDIQSRIAFLTGSKAAG